MSIRNLLGDLPLFDMSRFQIPSAIKEILDIAIQRFGFDFSEETAFITIELGRSLDFFNGLISFKSPTITLTVDRGDVSIVVLGNITLYSTQVELKLDYSPDTGQFLLFSEFMSNSFSFKNVVEELTTMSLPLPEKFSSTQQMYKIRGSVDNFSNGLISISVAPEIDQNRVFLILKRDNGTLETAIALNIANIPINDLIQTLSGQDVSSLSFIGKNSLPEVGFALSTGQINSKLMSEWFNSSSMLQCYGDTIPRGASGFFQLFEHLYRIVYQNNMISLTVKQGFLMVEDVLSLISVDLSKIRLPPMIGNILDINIDNFGLNLTSGISFVIVPYGRTVAFFDGLLSVNVPIVTLIVDRNIVNVEILGVVTLSGTPVELKFYYSPDTNQFHIVSEFFSSPSLSFGNVVEELTSLSLPLPSKFELESSEDEFKIIGTVDQTVSNGIVVISLSIGNKNRAFLILKRGNNILETAIAVDLASIMLSDVVHSVTGVSDTDFSHVPFVGTVSLPEMGLVFSSSSISSNLFQECFNNTFLLQCYGNTIPKGVSGFLDFDFSSKVYNITYLNGSITFLTKDGDLSVRKVLDLVLLPVDFQSIRIPSFLGDIFDTNINDFGLTIPANSISIDFELDDINLFGGLITISLPSIVLHVPLTGSNAVEVEVKRGQFDFGSVTFDFQINKESNGKYVFDASCDYIPLSSLVTGFSAKLLPDELQPLTQRLSFLNFGIGEFNMEIPLDSTVSNSTVFLSGKPVIAGYTVVCMTAVVVRDQNNEIDIVFDLDLGSANLANVLGEIAPPINSALKLIPILNQGIDLSLTMSPQRILDVSFSRANEQIDVQRGITIKADIPYPSSSSCGTDPFCLFLGAILPADTVLFIESTIVNTNNFQLIASFTSSINLGGLTITHAGMELRVLNQETTIGVIGKMSLENPRLDFTVRLFFAPIGMTLEMIAAGCWRDVFGLPIDICNVHGSIGIGASSTAITECSVGGEVHLGGKCNRPPLVAIGHVGWSTMVSQNKYYYASFPQGLTIDSLLQILCIPSSFLPSPIANTGLKPGFHSSYNGGQVPKIIPEIDLYIPPGFNLNGAVSIFGYEVKANILYTPKRMYVNIELQPIEIGNIFYMCASSSDRTKGPYLTADIRSNQLPAVEASGYIYLLGFSVEASLAITRDSMSATVEGRILNIVDARITITAPTTSSLSLAEFQVKGYTKATFHETIERAITDGAEGLASTTDSAVGAAQAVFDTASAVFDSASDGLASARRKVDNLQREFDSAVREVNRLIRKVDSICTRRRCGTSKFLS